MWHAVQTLPQLRAAKPAAPACPCCPRQRRTCGAAAATAPAQVAARGRQHQQALRVGLDGLKGDGFLGGNGVVLRLCSAEGRRGERSWGSVGGRLEQRTCHLGPYMRWAATNPPTPAAPTGHPTTLVHSFHASITRAHLDDKQGHSHIGYAQAAAAAGIVSIHCGQGSRAGRVGGSNAVSRAMQALARHVAQRCGEHCGVALGPSKGNVGNGARLCIVFCCRTRSAMTWFSSAHRWATQRRCG